MHITRLLKIWVHVSRDHVTIQRYVPLGSMVHAELERTETPVFIQNQGFLSMEGDARSYQWKVILEVLIMDEYCTGC